MYATESWLWLNNIITHDTIECDRLKLNNGSDSKSSANWNEIQPIHTKHHSFDKHCSNEYGLYACAASAFGLYNEVALKMKFTITIFTGMRPELWAFCTVACKPCVFLPRWITNGFYIFQPHDWLDYFIRPRFHSDILIMFWLCGVCTVNGSKSIKTRWILSLFIGHQSIWGFGPGCSIQLWD